MHDVNTLSLSLHLLLPSRYSSISSSPLLIPPSPPPLSLSLHLLLPSPYPSISSLYPSLSSSPLLTPICLGPNPLQSFAPSFTPSHTSPPPPDPTPNSSHFLTPPLFLPIPPPHLLAITHDPSGSYKLNSCLLKMVICNSSW